MNLKTNIIFCLISGLLLMSCVNEDPDLEFLGFYEYTNECNGQVEYIDVSNFYYVNNVYSVYPFGPQVKLYYRQETKSFHDCYGNRWFIIPQSQGSETLLLHDRPILNKPVEKPFTTTKPATNPSAVSYTTVTDSTGNKTTDKMNIEYLGNDIPAGSVSVFKGLSKISKVGEYELESIVDPINEIKERDELNNSTNSELFASRVHKQDGNKFTIMVPTRKELDALQTSYVIYSGGRILFIKK